MSKPSSSKRKLVECPTCGAVADDAARPFCSSRCADVDLGHWFQGKYAIPAVDAADDTIIDALVVGTKAGDDEQDDDSDNLER